MSSEQLQKLRQGQNSLFSSLRSASARGVRSTSGHFERSERPSRVANASAVKQASEEADAMTHARYLWTLQNDPSLADEREAMGV